ncbi:winged helix DNA-binding domain-containing protein [Actinoplanes sp. Pm04-4]|uniref:Winged helix DNA-binding domain-containing protein n=1 Tax=Paractinoplanes pyxinae TaxID=2997416 RepID=A0ABT4BH99_9ACTN|nr:winged helix DNA-binding domain-containing protein [Actinoplanes pyxinae]MCY1144975.1 winged helix DNA-binding domain-containing protein [Actinoplanes pyxinae]
MSDDERRARLAVRHALAVKVDSPEAATEAMTVLHATEPPTVYLSCWARVRSLSVADVDRALYVDRTLVKQLAMRRTLFVFPVGLLAAAWPSASARVAATERTRMAQDAVTAGLAEDGHEWLDQARTAVIEALAAVPDGRSALELRRSVPLIDVKVAVRAGEMWTAGRVLTHLGLTGDLVRGLNTGGWHVSRPQWTLMRHWLADLPALLTAEEGYRELVRRWLFTFGPGTEDDIVWWLGSTKAVVRTALKSLDAEPVTLDGGATGWLLPDDLDEVTFDQPWAALLPVLDPTVMGWKGRDFYLGPHREQLFDTRGNAGTTAWLNGRAVGCWVQDPSGAVHLKLLSEVDDHGRTLLEAEAERLTAWLDGFRVGSVYSSPAMKRP